MNPRRRRHARIRRSKRAHEAYVAAFHAAWAPFKKRVNESLDAMVGKAPHEKDGHGWNGKLDGACPVQGEGFVDGLPWYFRSRHEEWLFSVAPTPDGDPVAYASGGLEAVAFFAQGEHNDASWMPYAEAWVLIETCIGEYRSWRALPPEHQARALEASSR